MNATETVSTPDRADRMTFERHGPTEHSVSRVFRTSRERLWHLFTDPATLPVVWSQDPSKVSVETFDLRVGGHYSIKVVMPDGGTGHFHGDFLEVEPPSRLVNTWEFSRLEGAHAVETDTFETVPEGTRLTARWKYSTRDPLDTMLGPDMEQAVTKMWDAVARIVEPT